MLTKKLVKVGNSMGAIIPKPVRELLGWEGEHLEIEYHVDGDKLTLKPVKREPRPLVDLFAEGLI